MRNIAIIAGVLLALSWGLAGAGVYEDMQDAIKKDDLPVVIQLLKRGLDANTTDREGNSLLILAAKGGNLRTVKVLVASHAQIDARNALGESALMLAAMGGQLEVVRYLLEKGAQVNHGGWTPLIYAAVNGNVLISRLLLAYGAQVDGTADNGYTALMMAAREGHIALVAFLLAQHADPNLKTDDGLTALAAAQARNRSDIADQLVKAGAK